MNKQTKKVIRATIELYLNPTLVYSLEISEKGDKKMLVKINNSNNND